MVSVRQEEDDHAQAGNRAVSVTNRPEVSNEPVDKFAVQYGPPALDLTSDMENDIVAHIASFTPPTEDLARRGSNSPRNTAWNSLQTVRSSNERPTSNQDALMATSYGMIPTIRQTQMPWSGRHSPMSNLLGPQPNQGLDFSRPLSADLSMPIAISPPQKLLRMENLFWMVRAYCLQSFESGLWRYDKDSNLISLRGDLAKNTSVYLFYDLVRTAIRLFSRGLYVGGRQALSRATELISDMFRVEGPRTLESILTTLLLVGRRGHNEVYIMLQTYLKQAAHLTLGDTHPLSQILGLLSLSSPGDEDTLLQVWRCLSESFATGLGKFSIAATMCHINFIRAAYEQQEPVRAEYELREHLRQVRQGQHQHVMMATMLQLAHNLIVQRNFAEAEVVADEIFKISRLVEGVQQDYEGKVLEIKANMRYLHGDIAAAEELLRSSILHHAKLRGVDDSIVINLQIRLEAWLRESGKVGEADKLKQKTEQWLAKIEA